ncbi:MAG: serine protein kinase [Acidobacteriota bacterium]
MADAQSYLATISKKSLEDFQSLIWEGSFTDYLSLVMTDPRVIRTAYQRLYDMILSYGREEVKDGRAKYHRYPFFSDPIRSGEDAIYGLDLQLEKLVNVLKSSAYGYGPERRILLLHGPVGSSKSTIVRLLKRGLEAYARKPEGALYTFRWVVEADEQGRMRSREQDQFPCPMHEDPLKLIPIEHREQLLEEINKKADLPYRLRVGGDLCPACRKIYWDLMKRHNGDMSKVLEHIRVYRLLVSEKDRVGIGTFQPKDEKNQDSTELTGDVNFRKIAIYGSDSDPRAFNFDGELNIANRGIIEFIEILKLDVAFLYDLLGATQEHKIKPKKFPQTDIDEVIIGHTNEPEYIKLQNNEYMEALRDRTIKIDIPYITKLSDEVRIYERDFNRQKIVGKHIAPHTLEVAAMWSVLTRLEPPRKQDLTLIQKLKLYDGKILPGYTEDTVRELREESQREGMNGISPRYIQDKVSNTLVSDKNERCINPFMVVNELESGLAHHSLLSSEEMRQRYKELLSVVKDEYEETIKNEVRRAISADESAISSLFSNYVDNIKAYTQGEKLRNRFTGKLEEPDDRLMRSLEEKINIPENRKDDFRREIMNYIGALAVEGKRFDWRTDERLRKALEMKLFEDQKDSIKLSSLVSNVIDKETQEKIEIIRSRLIKNYGYCEVCSKDILEYISSVFARGDEKEE